MRKYIMLYLITLSLAQPVYAAVFHIASGDVAGLINAINTANSNGQDNTINLAAGTYTLTVVNNDTDGPNGLPSITSKLTIEGEGAGTIIIERDTSSSTPAFRIIHVANTGALTLDGITITGGDTQQNLEVPALGGGILNDGGKLSIIDSTISDNTAGESGAGGGVFNSGSAAITNSIISGNVAQPNALPSFGASGGGLANIGTMVISKSTISGNGAGFDGGISNSGNLIIDNSAIGFNSGIAFGGGIGNSGTLTVENTTIHDNSTVDAGGGGILNGGTVTLTNSTIAKNVGNCIVSGSGSGGGIANFGVVNMQNTIVAENSTPCGEEPSPGPDCFGVITSLGNNIIGDTSGCTITLQSADLTGAPGLGSFTDNGTPGNGHFPLLSNSQAINSGNNNVCLSNPILHTDQIGDPRVGICDIGSIEFEPFKNLGQCISTLIKQNCSGLKGNSRAACNHEQQTFCTNLFNIK